MDGVLNQFTETVHKHQTGASDLHTACGITHTLPPDQLRPVSISRATRRDTVSRCGRCFDDAGGY